MTKPDFFEFLSAHIKREGIENIKSRIPVVSGPSNEEIFGEDIARHAREIIEYNIKINSLSINGYKEKYYYQKEIKETHYNEIGSIYTVHSNDNFELYAVAA